MANNKKGTAHTVQDLVDPTFTPPAPKPTAVPGPAAPQPSSSSTGDMPNRVLQITLTRKEEVILARLQTRRTEQGARPSDCTKSRVIARALEQLAAAEGITGD